jgi:hypothetical protein
VFRVREYEKHAGAGRWCDGEDGSCFRGVLDVCGLYAICSSSIIIAGFYYLRFECMVRVLKKRRNVRDGVVFVWTMYRLLHSVRPGIVVDGVGDGERHHWKMVYWTTAR